MEENKTMPAKESEALILMAVCELKFVNEQIERIFTELEDAINYKHDLILSIDAAWPVGKKRMFLKDTRDPGVYYLVHSPVSPANAVREFKLNERLNSIRSFFLTNTDVFEEWANNSKPLSIFPEEIEANEL